LVKKMLTKKIMPYPKKANLLFDKKNKTNQKILHIKNETICGKKFSSTKNSSVYLCKKKYKRIIENGLRASFMYTASKLSSKKNHRL